MKKTTMIVITFLSMFFMTCKASLTYNVKDFGAIGNGNTDDIVAFENCFNVALKNNKSKIIIPHGTYKISRSLVISFLEQEIEIVGLENLKRQRPRIILDKNETVFHVKGFFFDISKGIFRISNLELEAKNLPYSLTHNKINKDIWYAGLIVTDKKAVYINNIIVKNIYGQGIHIADTKPVDNLNSSRFEYIEVSNCRIENVWGYNPKTDSYGDAIYVSNVAKGKIIDNFIFNDINTTKQLGRCGLVLEYMTENITIENNNIVGGYDRAIHIENTYGGHTILRNKFLGTDLALIIFEPKISDTFLPIRFYGNTFSNANMKKDNLVKKVYAKDAYGDRALISILSQGKSREKKIFFEENSLIVDENCVYDSNSILNNRSNAAFFLKNRYQITNNRTGRKLTIYNYAHSAMSTEIMSKEVSIK